MHPMMTMISKEDQEVSLKVNFYCDLCSFSCSVNVSKNSGTRKILKYT